MGLCMPQPNEFSAEIPSLSSRKKMSEVDWTKSRSEKAEESPGLLHGTPGFRFADFFLASPDEKRKR